MKAYMLLNSIIRGDMPSGSMTWTKSNTLFCSGYSSCGTITIFYNMQWACQKPYHPSPGRPHPGTFRTAYLPDNDEGNKLLTRLRAAFLTGFTFRIGPSLTTNIPDQGKHYKLFVYPRLTLFSLILVTWGSVHHKTSLHGGASRHGYPDESYISRCNSELTALQIPGEAVCARFVSRHENSDPAAADAVLLASRQSNDNSGGRFQKQNVKEIFGQTLAESTSRLMLFLGDVWTDDFKEYASQFGLFGVTVEPIPALIQTEMFKKFIDEGNKCCDQRDDKCDVRLAFHGTAEANIEPILRDGLDPSLRNGQSYGKSAIVIAASSQYTLIAVRPRGVLWDQSCHVSWLLQGRSKDGE